MRIFSRVLLLILMTGTAAALVYAAIVPWPALAFSEAVPETSVETPESATGVGFEGYRSSPSAIAGLFGYVPPKPPPEAPPPEVVVKPPQIARWIQFIGSATADDGGRRFVMKVSSPRELIVSLAIGESEEGILLADAEEDNLIIEFQEERYLVPLSNR